MRKGPNSPNALMITDLAEKQGFKSPYAKGDENWALVEAAEIETPVGEVHLHWFNHRGRGSWRFSQKGTTVCKTVRCRIVTIIPHGGENECCPIDGPDFNSVQEAWFARKSEKNRLALEEEKKRQAKRQELRKYWERDMKQIPEYPSVWIPFEKWRETLI